MSFGSGFGGFGSNQQKPATAFGGAFGQTNNQTTGGFGSSTNTGFGSNNNNNNNTGGSLFGGSNTNTGGAFGSTGFGSNNTPATNTAFGSSGGSLFGGGNNNNQTTGFTGFGSSTNNNQPSTGFGSSTGAFGSSTTGGSLFGGGGQSTGFGQPSTTTNNAFGQSTSTPFGQAAASTPPQNNGTSQTPFSPFTEREGNNGNQNNFQNIVCQPVYQSFSQEELRSVDYSQGRKYGNQNGQAGAFGQSTGFGGFGSNTNNNNTATTNTGFGGSTGGLFGQQNQTQNQSSGFGQPANTNTGFGGSTGGLFGAKPAATAGGLFGSTPATSAPTGGLFGNSGTTGGFGSNTGGFGSNNNNTTNTGGGLFGQAQQKPAGGLFGSSTTTNAFGSSTGAFGQQNQSTGGLFGNNNNTQQNNNNSQTSNPFGGGFGQNNQNQNQQQQGGGLFGQSNNNNNTNPFGQSNEQKPGGLFGGASSTGGLFGQNNNQQQPQQQTSSLFGGGNTQNNQGGGLFGQAQNQQKPGGLFGNTTTTTNNTGSSLFGGSFGQNNNNNQNQGSSLFGQNQNQNQTKSLFGNTTNTNTGGSSLFGGGLGQNNNNQQQQTQGSSLFGQPQQNQQQPQMGNSLFGNTQQQQQQQHATQQPQYLTTSINSETPYGNDQLFMSLNTPQQSVGPLITPLSSSQRPRQRAPLPTYRLNPAASSRMITPQRRMGYGFDYSSYGTPGSAFSNASPMYGRSLLSSGSMGRSLNKSLSMNNMRASFNAEDSILTPGAFSAGGLRGNGSGSLKKLKINRNLRTDLFGAEGTTDPVRASPLKKRVSFDSDPTSKEDEPNQNQGGEPSNALVRVPEEDSPTPSAEEQGYLRPSRGKANGASAALAHKEMEQVKGNELAMVPEDDTPSPAPAAPKPAKTAADIAKANQKDMEPGDYYMIPSRAEIDKMSRKDRANISPFTVGRENAGKIEFDKADLSKVDLDKIGGDIVRIEVRSATVYADHSNKPQPGNELNFPSKITLDNSWPRSKGGKLPIFERKGPRFDKHIERLRRVKETEFIKYDYEHGQWIFRVEHFSTYTFDYSDDESMLSPPPSSRPGGRSGLMPRQDGLSQQSQQQDDNSSHASSRRSSDVDDTFEFRTSKSVPGAFDGDVVSDDDDLPRGNDLWTDDRSVPSVEQLDSSVFEDMPMADRSVNMDVTIDNSSPAKQPLSDVNLISPIKATPMKPGNSILRSNAGATPFTTARSGYMPLDWTQQLQRTLSPKKQDRQTLRHHQGQAFTNGKPAPSGGLGGFTKESHPFATSIDVMNSLFGTQANKKPQQIDDGADFKYPSAKRHKPFDDLSDTHAMFNRSFRPSWASKGELNRSPTDANEKPAFENLNIFRQTANIRNEDGVPFAGPTASLKFTDLAQKAEDAHEKTMWQLAAVLFDEPQILGPDGEYDRKQKLMGFWKDLITNDAQTQMKNLQRQRRVSSEELALLQLSCNDIWAATESLSTGKNFVLSTMVAQIGANESDGPELQKMVTDQLDEWRSSNAISEIAPAVRALYELLAGNTCVSNGKQGAGPENKAESFNISARFGLDWRRAFALRLFYGITEEASAAVAVESYAKDVSTYREEIRPVPWFIEQNVATGSNDPHRQDRQDILFGLLKIFAFKQDDEGWLHDRTQLATIIAPESVAGKPTDCRLSFQLYQALSAHGIIDFSDDEDECDHRANTLATDYAFQLSSSADNLANTTFVTMHLRDPDARKEAIQALLNRYAASIGDGPDACPIFKSLVEDLLIPAPWIWNAKALHARTVLHSDVAECRYLLSGGDLNGAHTVFTDSVGPRCIVEEDRRTITDILELFRSKHLDQSLREWSEGAGVFANYFKILHTAEKGGDAQEAMHTVKDIGPQLKEMQKAESLVVRVAACEMAEKVQGAVEGFARRLGGEVDSEKVLPSMPMASEMVLSKVETLSKAYYGRVGVH